MTSIFLRPVVARHVASFGTHQLISLTRRWHGALPLDHDLHGMQKTQAPSMQRLGGIGMATTSLLVGVFSYQLAEETYETANKLVLCTLTSFGTGLIQDSIKRGRIRLLPAISHPNRTT